MAPTNQTLNHCLTFQIRRATRDDIPFLSKCVVQADQIPYPDSLSCWERLLARTSVGDITLDCLNYVFEKKNSSPFSVENWIVAEGTDGTLLGAACFTPDGDRSWDDCYAAIRERATQYHHMPVAELEVNMVEVHVLDKVLPSTHRPDTWLLEYVATAPAAQGKGVASALISAGLWLGHVQQPEHSARAQSVVYIGNKASRGLQEKLGFVVAQMLTDVDVEEVYGPQGAWIMELDDVDKFVRERLGGCPEWHMVRELVEEKSPVTPRLRLPYMN